MPSYLARAVVVTGLAVVGGLPAVAAAAIDIEEGLDVAIAGYTYQFDVTAQVRSDVQIDLCSDTECSRQRHANEQHNEAGQIQTADNQVVSQYELVFQRNYAVQIQGCYGANLSCSQGQSSRQTNSASQSQEATGLSVTQSEVSDQANWLHQWQGCGGPGTTCDQSSDASQANSSTQVAQAGRN